MTSYTLQVQPRVQYTIEYANQRGPQGATGAAGSTTTDASLLVSGTLSDARLSSNVALENVANVFTAKQSFSGTNHVGLCLLSLTSAEYNALTPANGDLFRDSTTDRIDARLARGTVELIDSAGGQTINGALTATGQIRSSANGAASTPATYLTGTWFSGGTGITNKPQLLIEPTGTTSTAWNTNGTGIGVNAASGFLGLLVDAKVNNSTLFSVNYQGVVSGSGFTCASGWTYSTVGNAFYDSSGTLQRFRIGGTTYFTIGTSGSDVVGNFTASGTLRVGGGTVVASILSATATLDFPSISNNAIETLTITVTGAVAGDSVFLGCPAGLDAGLVFCASVTAANTVTVRMHNSTGGPVDPASGTFRATVIRF
jgi:hypothetical protein